MIDVKQETVKLVLDLQDLSKKADYLKFQGKNIIRLKRRTVAELAEDRFAEYLYDVLDEKDVEIYINGDLNGKRPDIMVVKNNTLISIVELKMNFGWCRNIFDPIRDGKSIYDEHSSQIHDRYKDLTSILNSTISFFNGIESIELYIPKDCKIYYVTTNMENYISNRNMIDDYNDFVKRNGYDKIIKFGIISQYYRYNRTTKTWPNKKNIIDSVDVVINTEYGMLKIINNIKKELNK